MAVAMDCWALAMAADDGQAGQSLFCLLVLNLLRRIVHLGQKLAFLDLISDLDVQVGQRAIGLEAQVDLIGGLQSAGSPRR